MKKNQISSREDYIYDRFVHLANDLGENGWTELEILQYMESWILSCIKTSKEYNLTNSEDYKILKTKFK